MTQPRTPWTRTLCRWPRILALLLTTGCLPLLGGCLEVDAHTTIAEDGSGTFVQTGALRMDDVRKRIRAILATAAERGLERIPVVEDPFGILSILERSKSIRAAAGIESFKSTAEWSKDRSRHTSLCRVRFKTLKDLYASGACEDLEARLAKTKDGAWLLTLRYTVLDAPNGGRDTDASAALQKLRKALLARLKPHLGGFALVHRLTLPTAVIETNGSKDASGRTVTWRLGYDDLADPAKWVCRVKFKATDDLKLEPFPK